MSNNLIELSERLLGKFLTRRGSVKGTIDVPAHVFAREMVQLKSFVPGESWSTPIGGMAFEFLLDDKYHIAITINMETAQIDSIIHESSGWLQPVKLPGAVFLRVADKLQLQPISMTAEEVEEFIEGPASNDGVSLEAIIERLDPYQVFCFSKPLSNPESEFITATNFYVANYISTFDSELLKNNRLSNKALSYIRDFFLEEKEQLFVENLFYAMSTPLLTHAFLEIYRTLEFVFVLPRADSLLKRIGGQDHIKLKILDFARVCYQELGWKRVERDALHRLLSDYILHSRDSFDFLCQTCQPFRNLVVPTDTSEGKEHQRFMNDFVDVYYKLRNQVAHQFWADEIRACTESDWRQLIDFTLGCALHTYNKHLIK